MSQNEDLDDICKELDNLLIKNLELMEEKVFLTVKLEKLIRQGHINLAKARYIRGKESVGLLQIPSNDLDMRSLFDLEHTLIDNEINDIPRFDVSLKKSIDDEPQNPIKWFGVLVPQSLRFAQKYFQDAVYVAVKLANVQAELTKSTIRTNNLKVSKKNAA